MFHRVVYWKLVHTYHICVCDGHRRGISLLLLELRVVLAVPQRLWVDYDPDYGCACMQHVSWWWSPGSRQSCQPCTYDLHSRSGIMHPASIRHAFPLHSVPFSPATHHRKFQFLLLDHVNTSIYNFSRTHTAHLSRPKKGGFKSQPNRSVPSTAQPPAADPI
jgi:hypothetical protein